MMQAKQNRLARAEYLSRSRLRLMQLDVFQFQPLTFITHYLPDMVTKTKTLEYGVVTCLPDRTMGGKNNYVLAGHYMGSYGPAVLDNLHLAKIGDLIYVTDLHHIYAYETKVFRLQSSLLRWKSKIMLMTKV